MAIIRTVMMERREEILGGRLRDLNGGGERGEEEGGGGRDGRKIRGRKKEGNINRERENVVHKKCDQEIPKLT